MRALSLASVISQAPGHPAGPTPAESGQILPGPLQGPCSPRLCYICHELILNAVLGLYLDMVSVAN